MKKTLSVLLTLIMLAGVLAVGTVSASAAVKTTDAAFTDNFVLLDYIENTNGQYINTGYKAGKDVTVSVNLEITAWNHSYAGIFGSRSDNHSANSFVMCQYESNNKLRSEIGVKNYTDHAVGLNTRSELSLSGSDKFSGTGLEIYLFGLNQSNALEKKWGAATYKLYSCKITDGGKVVRDFVPAQRKSDNAVGLYDLQEGKFYGSASGTGLEITKEHNVHCFGKDGKCTLCEKEFSLDDYNPVAGKEYFETFYFPGAKEIIFSASDVKTDVTLCDKNGNEITYSKKDTDIRNIPGDTLTVSAPVYQRTKYITSYGRSIPSGTVSEPAFVLKDIAPIFDDTATEVIAPTCREEGYSVFTYGGNQYKFNFVAPNGHSFDKNGVCTECNVAYSEVSYKNSGYLSFGDRARFEGAKKVAVLYYAMNTTKSGRSISAVAYDDNGNKISKEVSAGSTKYGYIIVDGEYARGAVENTLNDDIRYEFSPIYDDSTGSVLSEGNIWVIIAVAVLALVGVTALIIVKKKKKPALASGTDNTDEE